MEIEMDPLKQRIAQMKGATTATQEARRAWLDDIAALFQQIEVWLADEISAKDVKVFSQDTEVKEQDGSYWTKQLAMQFEAVLLLVVPRGMNVVGALLQSDAGVMKARGRLDLINFHDRRHIAIFRGRSGEWFVPTPDNPVPWTKLDKDSFRAAMASIL